MTLDLDVLRETWDFEAKLAAGQDGRGAVPRELWPTYSAMANTHGGVIVLGVREMRDGSFEVNGIEDIDRVERDLWNLLGNRQKVSVNVLGRDDVVRHEVGGRTVLELRVRQATRTEKPVHLNGNPFGNTWIRTHDGDRQCDDERVRRMIADATYESRDDRVLPRFTRQDLDAGTLKTYRQVFASRSGDHPWNALDDAAFLTQLGAWRRDRESGDEGLTAAGLLLLGRYETIREVFPNYFVDYQERAADADAIDWLDRVFPDGTWSGNIYDFYRRVIARLTANLRVPFELSGDLHRRDETHVHEAMREALVNALIHADYDGRVSVLVIKRPDAFEFRNPGALRLSPEQIRAGGTSDCRNRTLQRMFLMLGIGEQAGSGFSRILRAWREQSWQAPALDASIEPDQTQLVLRMVSLLPPQVVAQLREEHGEAFDRLSANARLAVTVAAAEQSVTNRRLQEVTDAHGRDLTNMLRDLVRDGFLEPHGERQGRWYSPRSSLARHPATSAASSEQSSAGRELQSIEKTTEVKTSSEQSSEQSSGQGAGQTTGQRADWQPMAESQDAVLAFCRGTWRSLPQIAAHVHRAESTVRRYLRPLVKTGELVLRYPDEPTHPEQAYQAARRTRE